MPYAFKVRGWRQDGEQIRLCCHWRGAWRVLNTLWACGSPKRKAPPSGLKVCSKLANRGVKDMFIVCCDGLTGLADVMEATWPDSMVQTYVVHLIRVANR